MSKPKNAETDPKADKAAAKAALKKGADELRKAQAAEKKKAAPAKPPVKDGGKLDVLPPMKPIIPAKGEIGELVRKCLTFSPDQRFVTGIDVETTTGEYLRLFDNFQAAGECWQLIIGSLIYHGRTLKDFGGSDNFAAAMAASGRSLSSCKAYESTFVNTPTPLLKLGVPYTALRHTVKVKDKEKKETLIREIAAAEKAGEPMTVEQVKAKAEKLAPKKKKPAPAKVEYKELTSDETTMLETFTGFVGDTHKYMEAMSFLREVEPAKTDKLRGMLADIAKFSAKLDS